MMRIIITDSYRQMGREAANMVAGQLYLKPDSVLGLATGSTPLPMYRRLIALHRSLGWTSRRSRRSTSTSTSAWRRKIRRATTIS